MKCIKKITTIALLASTLMFLLSGCGTKEVLLEIVSAVSFFADTVYAYKQADALQKTKCQIAGQSRCKNDKFCA